MDVVTTPKLILLNGPPAVGKTSIARRYANEHSLTLHLDVDQIRDMISGWQIAPIASGLRTRSMIEAMAAVYLGSGHDVIVSQLYGRIDGLESLEEVSRTSDATWVELALIAPMTTIEERFVARGGSQLAALAANGRPIGEQLAELQSRLTATLAERPKCVTIDTSSNGYDANYEAVVSAIEAHTER